MITFVTMMHNSELGAYVLYGIYIHNLLAVFDLFSCCFVAKTITLRCLKPLQKEDMVDMHYIRSILYFRNLWMVVCTVGRTAGRTYSPTL